MTNRTRVLATLRGAALATSALFAFAAPGSAQELAPVKVVFIQHCCSGATFFQPMQFGAEEAARLFQVDLNYVNADGDAARAANLIETAIADKADAVLPTITVPVLAVAMLWTAIPPAGLAAVLLGWMIEFVGGSYLMVRTLKLEKHATA